MRKYSNDFGVEDATGYLTGNRDDDYSDGNQETLGFTYEEEIEHPSYDYQDEEPLNEPDDDLLDEEDDYRANDDDATRAADISILLNENDKFYKNLSKEQIKEEWRGIVHAYRYGDEKERKEALDSAIQQLSGFVHSKIERKYKSYYESDKTFEEDLEQAGKMGIIKGLKSYDPNISMPTTFFERPIDHELFDLVNGMKHEAKPHIATTKKKLEAVDKLCEKEGYKATLPWYHFITGAPYRRIINVLATRDLNTNKLDINDPDAKQIADSDPMHLGTESEAISNANMEEIQAVMRQICKNDDDLFQCIMERFVDGMSLEELADKYGRPKDKLANEINIVLRQMQYDDRMATLYPERAPSDRRRNENDEILTIPDYEDQLKNMELWDLLQEQNDETLRDENRRMSNYRDASFQFDDAHDADEE
ncbi:hypothetical protein [Clostridium fessum]|uniref:hypothetical protein n=1 Tax=Clostridium fessum TaxID=2126740 RepID=UPI0022E45210|nr:hypothetical protein [Clostridium fessum]